MPNSKLLPPLPPFVRRTDPELLAWRQDQHADAIEHLNKTKLSIPHGSWLPLIGVLLSLILGLTGLVSPATVAGLVMKFVH